MEALIHLAIAKYELTLGKNIITLNNSYKFDKSEQRFYLNEEEISLTKKEKLFISTLIENLNNYVSYELLERIIWYDEYVLDSTKRTFYSRTRQKFSGLSFKTRRSLGIGVFVN